MSNHPKQSEWYWHSIRGLQLCWNAEHQDPMVDRYGSWKCYSSEFCHHAPECPGWDWEPCLNEPIQEGDMIELKNGTVGTAYSVHEDRDIQLPWSVAGWFLTSFGQCVGAPEYNAVRKVPVDDPKHPDHEPPKPNLPELPEGWRWLEVGEIRKEEDWWIDKMGRWNQVVRSNIGIPMPATACSHCRRIEYDKPKPPPGYVIDDTLEWVPEDCYVQVKFWRPEWYRADASVGERCDHHSVWYAVRAKTRYEPLDAEECRELVGTVIQHRDRWRAVAIENLSKEASVYVSVAGVIEAVSAEELQEDWIYPDTGEPVARRVD